jgi:endonuclease/exonuclease/phosphatase family metal-dependent hydrolase
MQEVKGTARGHTAMRYVTERLGALTGDTWRYVLDGCPGRGRQHVALLYDASRLTATHQRDVAALNPSGGAACDHMMRPGLGVYLKRPSGVDFHLVAVHLKSGAKRGDLRARRRSLAGLAAAYAGAQAEVRDTDVLVVGDFNTMGCSRCRPEVAPVEELGVMDTALAALPHAFRRVSANQSCSEYYRGRGGLLDHVVATRSMRELRPGAQAIVGGLCAERACGSWRGSAEPPSAYLELSDHCPVVVEVDDVDLDP